MANLVKMIAKDSTKTAQIILMSIWMKCEKATFHEEAIHLVNLHQVRSVEIHLVSDGGKIRL